MWLFQSIDSRSEVGSQPSTWALHPSTPGFGSGDSLMLEEKKD